MAFVGTEKFSEFYITLHSTKEIEDLVMEGFIPSIPGEVELFSNEDVCIISKEKVGHWRRFVQNIGGARGLDNRR